MLLKRKRSEEGKRRDIFGGGGDIKPVRVGYINAERRRPPDPDDDDGDGRRGI